MEASSADGVQVWVDPDLCAASAMCIRIAPQIFELPDDADTAIVKMATVTDPELIKLAEEAEVACPTMAIKLTR